MYDTDLEKTLLFFIVFQNYDCDVTENDFVDAKHKQIIKAINECKANNEEVNFNLVLNKIKENRAEYTKYLAMIGDLVFKETPNSIYNKIVQMTQNRDIYKLLNESKNKLITGEMKKSDILLAIESVTDRSVQKVSFQDQVVAATKDLEDKYNHRDDYSLYTELLSLDNKILGLHNGELTIIGARPGVGKTTLALQIAENLARKGKKIMFVSLEMSANQIIHKMISRSTGINSYILRSGRIEDDSQWEKIAKATSDLQRLGFKIIDNTYTIQSIANMARKLKYQKELDVLFIDYLQLIKGDGNYQSREREVADITRILKLLSLEINIPIIALCQLNRNAAERVPGLADLRESGSIEQDADNVFFLYPNEQAQLTDSYIPIDLKIAKQRAGEIGVITLNFDKRRSEFYANIDNG